MRIFCILLLVSCQVFCAEQTQAGRGNAAAFLDQLNEHFKTWDADSNGKLSLKELDAAACNAKTVGAEAAAIAALKRVLNNPKLTPPELTLENVTKLSKEPPTEGPNFPRMYAEGVQRVSRANRVIFSSSTPQLASLHQGKLGDCFCLAPLGAMLHRDPKQVTDMFHVHPDGKCTVVLGKKTVTIDLPTDVELAMSSSARQEGIWINLYEKAIGVVRNESRPEKDQTGSPLDTIAKGGSAGMVLGLITGHRTTGFRFKFFQEDTHSESEKIEKMKALREQLAAAIKNKRLVTTGTQVVTTPGLTPNHAYAILDFDEKADAVQIWNPHGTNFAPKGTPSLTTGYPRKDGIFTMPLADFVKQFTGLAIEREI